MNFIKEKFKKNIIFLGLCFFITSCTSNKHQFSFSTDIDLKNADSDFNELFSTVEQGGSGLFYTYDAFFPIFSENNLEEPNAIQVFAGEKGDEIRFLSECTDKSIENKSNDFCEVLLSDLNLEYTNSCVGEYGPIIYKGTITKIGDFIYKVEGDYVDMYSNLENTFDNDTDFIFKIEMDASIDFMFTKEEVLLEKEKSKAYYVEPDGMSVNDICKFRT